MRKTADHCSIHWVSGTNISVFHRVFCINERLL